jgi:transcription antitermination factor NusG
MSNMRLSLHDFKNWLAGQKDLSDFFNIGLDKEDPYERFIGKEVQPKVSEQKILERIETEDDPEIIVSEFMDTGGTILTVDGKKVQIEVDSGTFFLPRFCVRVLKEE